MNPSKELSHKMHKANSGKWISSDDLLSSNPWSLGGNEGSGGNGRNGGNTETGRNVGESSGDVRDSGLSSLFSYITNQRQSSGQKHPSGGVDYSGHHRVMLNYQNDTPKDDDDPFVLKENFIMINSIDRQYLHESRFHFQCRFASSSNEYEKRAVYVNNPTIPQTEQEKTRGVLGPINNRGWIDHRGNKYPPYDPSQPYGDIIGYDYIASQGDNLGCVIDKKFQQIVSIQVEKVFFPILMNHHPLKTGEQYFYDLFPYMLIDIDELPNSWNGTNQDIMKTNNVLVSYMEKIPYHIFENIQTEPYSFSPPKNDLKVLTFRLQFPDGDTNSTTRETNGQISRNDIIDINTFLSPNDNRDQVKIISIKPTLDSTTLDITLDCYISPSLFKAGHRIIIRDYYPYPAMTGYQNISLESFKNFITTKPHVIISSTDHVNQYGLTNRLTIAGPSQLYCDRGIIHPDNYFTHIANHLRHYPEARSFNDTDDALVIWKFTVQQKLGLSFNINLGGHHLGSLQYNYWHFRIDAPFDNSGRVNPLDQSIYTYSRNTVMSESFTLTPGLHTVSVCITDSEYRMIYPAKSHTWIIENYHSHLFLDKTATDTIELLQIDSWIQSNSLNRYGLRDSELISDSNGIRRISSSRSTDTSGSTLDSSDYLLLTDGTLVDKYGNMVDRYDFIRSYFNHGPWKDIRFEFSSENSNGDIRLDSSLNLADSNILYRWLSSAELGNNGMDGGESGMAGGASGASGVAGGGSGMADGGSGVASGGSGAGGASGVAGGGSGAGGESGASGVADGGSGMNASMTLAPILTFVNSDVLKHNILRLTINSHIVNVRVDNNDRQLPMNASSKELVSVESSRSATLFNQQLQTHILLKIITREADTSRIQQSKKNIVI